MHYKVCLNGQLIEGGEEFIRRTTPGLLNAAGCFETLRADGRKVFFVPEHYKRLKKGLNILGIKIPVAFKAFKQNLNEVLAANPFKHGRVRVIVFKKKRKVEWMVAHIPYKVPSKEKLQKGYEACWVKQFSLPARYHADVKSLEYKFFLSAYQTAWKKGLDEAVLIDQRGNVIEGSRSNIFMIKKNRIYTPSLASGCLRGITRSCILKIARAQGNPCTELMLKAAKLKDADELFLTNSLLGVMPLTSMNGQKIGQGRPGPVTRKFRRQYEMMKKDNSCNY